MALYTKKIIGRISSLFSFLIFSNSVMADDNLSRISIAVGEMPYLLSARPELSGAYNAFMDKLNGSLKQKFELIYFPPARAGQEFESKNYDCLMPGQMAGMVERDKRIASKPFSYARAYIFNAIDQPTINSLDAMHGQILATRRGFVYGNLKLDERIKTFEVNHIHQSIEMLGKNRIDAFIAYEPDIISILDKLPVKTVHRGNLVLHEQPEKVICHRSENTTQFINEFNQILDNLSVSGELKSILGKGNFSSQ